MHDATESTHLAELQNPGAPDQVVRLGATLTVVAGFGRTADVVAWIAAAIGAAQMLGADALDVPVADPDARRAEIDAMLDALESRAELLEAEHAQLVADMAADRERRAAAGGLDKDLDASFDRRTQAQAQIEAELAEIDARGNALANERCTLAEPTRAPSPAEAIGAAEFPLIVDGLLFDAVTTDVFHDVLDRLIDASAHRQVVVVIDDPAIERWAMTVPGGAVWTAGDSLRLRGAAAPPPISAWDARFEADQGARRLGVHASGDLLVCSAHSGAVTRLTCASCGLPYCDVCLVQLGRDGRVMCVRCALDRAGVRKRRRR